MKLVYLTYYRHEHFIKHNYISVWRKSIVQFTIELSTVIKLVIIEQTAFIYFKKSVTISGTGYIDTKITVILCLHSII